MHNIAYKVGALQAFVDAGYASPAEFFQKFAAIAPVDAARMSNMVAPEEYATFLKTLPQGQGVDVALAAHAHLPEVYKELNKTPDPSLWQRVSRMWSGEAEAPFIAKDFLDQDPGGMLAPENSGLNQNFVERTPEGYHVSRFDAHRRNTPMFHQTDVKMPTALPAAEEMVSAQRWGNKNVMGTVPMYGLGGAGVGAALGAGIGAGFANEGEGAHDALVGGAIGAGVGGLGGVGLGYLRGGALGRGQAIAEQVAEAARKAF